MWAGAGGRRMGTYPARDGHTTTAPGRRTRGVGSARWLPATPQGGPVNGPALWIFPHLARAARPWPGAGGRERLQPAVLVVILRRR
ncbi:hypothetical protein GCM10023324_05950 [Streptomyces youssoufiensis]